MRGKGRQDKDRRRERRYYKRKRGEGVRLGREGKGREIGKMRDLPIRIVGGSENQGIESKL